MNYIGQAMYNLHAAVQDDPDIIAKFEKRLQRENKGQGH